MSDVFDEVTAELRRDRASAAWARYGRYIIGAAIGLVVLVATVTGVRSYMTAQEEAASMRYDAMVKTVSEAAPQTKIDQLMAFAAAEDNGYGALAQLSAALIQAEQGDAEVALEAFDALAKNRSLPDSLRDFANLQAAIVLLDTRGDLQAIELRLDGLLRDDNGLQPMARETMALAYMTYDQPLKARELFKAQISDPNVTNLPRERARIMLQSVADALAPHVETKK